MPNHIQNRLIIESKNLDEILAHIKGENVAMDFNTIVPMPSSLKVTNSSTRDAILAILPKGIRDVSQITDELRSKARQVVSQWIDNEEFERILREAVISNDNNQLYGYTDWYDWSYAHWDTKWNAYEDYAGDNSVYFQTAWSTPKAVIKALSKLYPDATFHVDFADEDWGYNCGSYTYKNGEYTDTTNFANEDEAIAFAKEIWGFDDED